MDQRLEQGICVRSWIAAQHRLSVYHIHAEQHTEIELFALQSDPHEFNNLAESPAPAGVLRERMLAMDLYQDRVGSPWPVRHALA